MMIMISLVLCLALDRRRLANGAASLSLDPSVCVECLFPLQFPFETSLHKEFITRRAWVFLQNSETVGLSLVHPLCRWHPKTISSGS